MSAVSVDEFDPVEVPRERFVVDDDSSATWAMRKALAAQRAIDEVQAIAAAEVERITAWAERETAGHQHDYDYFAGLLIAYGMAQRQEGRKSVSLPYGKITSRAGSKSTQIDPEVFVPWAKEHAPDLVKVETKETPIKAAIAKAGTVTDDGVLVTADGEVVPGVTVTTGDVTYNVEVSR